MSEQLYRNPWAEKLSQVSLPDGGGGDAWKAMEALLEREMPVGRRGDRRRWVLLILGLLLLIGVCNCPGRKMFFGGKTESKTESKTEGKTEGKTESKTETFPAIPASGKGEAGPSAPAAGAVASGGGERAGGTVVQAAVDSARGKRVVGAAKRRVPVDLVPRDSVAGKVGTREKGGVKTGAVKKPGIEGVRTSGAEKSGGQKSGVENSGVKKSGVQKSGVRKTSGQTGGKKNGKSIPADGMTGSRTAGQVDSDTADSAAKVTGSGLAKVTGSGLAQVPANGSVNGSAKISANDSAKHPLKGPVKNPAKAPPQAARNEARNQAQKEDSAKKERHDGFMVGIGLNQFFTLGGQQASSFNSGGITGTLGDYIPVPMLRYYFNPKLYVQLEAQINTPQYTKKNLVAVSTPADSIGTTTGGATITVQQSVAINKLFYFNVPLSVHYTVFDHLDLGAGLQYSRLTNGIGVFNQNYSAGGVDSLSTATKSFKGDTVYREIKTYEFRFLIDANYNWRRFILGVRYNQALSKFIHVEISPGQITQARNSSLQLYLRYILWDGRKKNPSLLPAK